ncbi:MAG: CocE/NonD family hydrolase [Bryobacteraceae bacterium]|nr:CocE/NonD family hydrolase [Bryobacteraceae bacterium]
MAHRTIWGSVLWLAAIGAAQEFDSFTVSTEMVAMRDGVKLATDIYRPARSGQAVDERFPVLLVRTPYNKAGVRGDAEYLARRGYVVAAQDCRGRFASEGEFYAFLNEGKDGYDAIEWAGAQPWSNGKVGTLGGSYLAWDQYHAAMYKPPRLEAMFAVVGGANFYQEFGYPGGALNLGWPLWLLGSARSSQQASANPDAVEKMNEIAKQPGAWLREDPKKRGEIFRGFPAQQRMYEDLYAHPAFDRYWKQRGWYTAGYYREMKDVPTVFLTGWYDYFGPGSIRTFAALSEKQKSAKKLIVGPWPHGVGGRQCGDAWFGEAAGLETRAYIADWFDHTLKGKPLALIGSEPVRIFRMGGGSGSRTAEGKLDHGGEWRTAAAWPHPAAGGVRYYLHPGGGLRTARPAGAGEPSSYDYDPMNPVPTIGGRYGVGAATPGCAQDQVCRPDILGCDGAKPLNSRPDVLSFQSEPLDAPVEVTGFVQAKYWVSSDAPDADFTAKLVDVYPDGYALIVADGQIRAQFRNSFEKPRPMKAGKTYEVTIELGPTSNLFAAGHRIRLDVSSSNFPNVEPNPRKARNSIYHDARKPSYVELPVVK